MNFGDYTMFTETNSQAKNGANLGVVKLDIGVDTSQNTAEKRKEIKWLQQYAYQRMLESIELDHGDLLTKSENINEHISEIVRLVEKETDCRISSGERAGIESYLHAELIGLGPIEKLMSHEDVTDILINGWDEVWVDKSGRLEITDVHFDNELHLQRFVDRILQKQGKTIDACSPIVDAMLEDGSRFNVVIKPLSPRGTIVSIRKFRTKIISTEELVDSGFINGDMIEFFKLAMESRLNIMISGGAGSGKTTLLNFLSQYIPEIERLVTVEDVAELSLQHPHVISLQSKSANSEGVGGIAIGDLLHTALRMRADRIIVGEVRGPEVFDMLQAMNVGHDGSLTTVHANNPDNALQRIEALSLSRQSGYPREIIQGMIGSAIHLNIHLNRFRDGKRRISSVSYIYLDNGVLRTKELFSYKLEQTESPRDVRGEHLYNAANSEEILSLIEQKGFSVCSSLRPTS